MLTRIPMRHHFAIVVFACLSFISMDQDAYGSVPTLTQVLPQGVQRGVEHKVTFTGERLGDTEEVFFYDEGFRVTNLKVINAKKVEVIVAVDAECRLGEHMVQLRTRSGISGYRILQVEAYPAVDEAEKKNNARGGAQLIEPVAYSDKFPKGVGVVVSGRMLDEDHDWFSVKGTEGDRLSIEVVGTRLGDFCDTVLELYGPDGQSLAIVDDTPLTKQDPMLSIRLAQNGRYLIHLADSAGRGQNNAWYRMHVGNFPRPSIASPAVAKKGKVSEITFLGDCSGPIKQALQVVEEDLYQDGIQISDRLGTTPTPVPLRIVAAETQIVSEEEPNDGRGKLQEESISLPCSVHGGIDKQGDHDWFSFKAKKGERIQVEAFGHRIGSAIDTTIRIRRSNGKTQATSTDTVETDSLLTTTIPEDGRYFVEIQNASDDFGPMMKYQLDVQREQSALSIGIKEFQRYTQQRQQIAVPAGNRFAVLINAERAGFDGPFELTGDQLPDSIRMLARSMPSGAIAMPVVFEADSLGEQADEGAAEPLDGQLIDLTAKSISESEDDQPEAVVGRFKNRAQLMRVQPNNMCMKFGVVEKLAVARLEPVPFSIDLVPPSVPVSQNGRLKLQVNIHRDEGFKAPIILRLPFRPPGINAKPTVRVTPNQKTVDYSINASDKAAVGEWPICVTAVAPNDLGAMVSTGLHDLKVVTPFVEVTSDLISAEAGSKVVAKCSLEVLREFEGTAEARLTGLPHQVTSESQQIETGNETISFPIVVGDNCPTGKNHSVNVEVTVMQNGHPIVFRAGRLLMRFAPSAQAKDKSGRNEVTAATSSGEAGQQ